MVTKSVLVQKRILADLREGRVQPIPDVFQSGNFLNLGGDVWKIVQYVEDVLKARRIQHSYYGDIKFYSDLLAPPWELEDCFLRSNHEHTLAAMWMKQTEDPFLKELGYLILGAI